MLEVTNQRELEMKLSETQIDVTSYDRTIIAFSGGKDSLACILYAIEAGCPNIELWHHAVDGREGSTLMDWTVTEDYCRKVAEALDIPIYFSWLSGGFEREMLRENERKAATQFETPDGLFQTGGVRGKETTRLKFPQISGDLSVRWCSAYLKIDVCSIALTNQERFRNSRTLLISGERAEESPQRAKYKEFEPDRADNRDGKYKRHIDRFRPVHKYTELQIWDLIKKFKINPHPAYRLGWGRLSCLSCIFGSPNQWATIKAIAPSHFETIAEYEELFETTIHRTLSVREQADKGTPYEWVNNNVDVVNQAFSATYTDSVIVENWEYPAGAFGESTGPT